MSVSEKGVFAGPTIVRYSIRTQVTGHIRILLNQHAIVRACRILQCSKINLRGYQH